MVAIIVIVHKQLKEIRNPIYFWTLLVQGGFGAGTARVLTSLNVSVQHIQQ